MGNYIIFLNVRKSQEKQASKKFYNKCAENSRSQIVFRTDIFPESSCYRYGRSLIHRRRFTGHYSLITKQWSRHDFSKHGKIKKQNIGLILMLSHDHGIATLIQVCNCQTYVNNYKNYRMKAFKLIQLVQFFGCNFLCLLFSKFQNSRKAQPYFDRDSFKVLPQIAANIVSKK